MIAHAQAIREENYTPFKASIGIYSPICTATLFSIFRYPVSWNKSGPQDRQSITCIKSVVLNGEGALVVGDPLCAAPEFRNMTFCFLADLTELSRHDRTRQSLREMKRFLPAFPLEAGNHRRPLFQVIANAGPDSDAYFANVSTDFLQEEQLLTSSLYATAASYH